MNCTLYTKQVWLVQMTVVTSNSTVRLSVCVCVCVSVLNGKTNNFIRAHAREYTLATKEHKKYSINFKPKYRPHLENKMAYAFLCTSDELHVPTSCLYIDHSILLVLRCSCCSCCCPLGWPWLWLGFRRATWRPLHGLSCLFTTACSGLCLLRLKDTQL